MANNYTATDAKNDLKDTAKDAKKDISEGAEKLAGDAKDAVAFGAVSVNGATETRRGRQLVVGDVVALGEEQARVASGDADDVDVPW